jgi:hypothetical protein
MTDNNDGPIYSILTGKGPIEGCGTAANCPEGYCRYNLCDNSDSEDPLYYCAKPPQINCYTYTDPDYGWDCVSYCY